MGIHHRETETRHNVFLRNSSLGSDCGGCEHVYVYIYIWAGWFIKNRQSGGWLKTCSGQRAPPQSMQRRITSEHDLGVLPRTPFWPWMDLLGGMAHICFMVNGSSQVMVYYRASVCIARHGLRGRTPMNYVDGRGCWTTMDYYETALSPLHYHGLAGIIVD